MGSRRASLKSFNLTTTKMTKNEKIIGVFDLLDKLTLERWYYFHVTGGKNITSCHLRIWKNYKKKLHILAIGYDEVQAILDSIKSDKLAYIVSVEQVELNILCFSEVKSFKGVLLLQNLIHKNYVSEWVVLLPLCSIRKTIF